MIDGKSGAKAGGPSVTPYPTKSIQFCAVEEIAVPEVFSSDN